MINNLLTNLHNKLIRLVVGSKPVLMNFTAYGGLRIETYGRDGLVDGVVFEEGGIEICSTLGDLILEIDIPDNLSGINRKTGLIDADFDAFMAKLEAGIKPNQKLADALKASDDMFVDK